MDTVRAAVIGVGNIGYFHAKNILKQSAGMTLAALCDIDGRSSSGQWAAGVDILRLRELLTAHVADAVIIATPHYLHPPSLPGPAGWYHVLVEKPAGVYAGRSGR